jgi:hypothetical protein
VTTPVALCLPAEVDGSTIVGPLAALVCYTTTTTASAVGIVPVSTVIATDDFDVGLPAGVCVPTVIQSLIPAP